MPLGATYNRIDARDQFVCEHMEGDGAVIFRLACALDCEGIVSKRAGSPYRSGRSKHWVKVKNLKAPAARRLEEEEWR